MKTYKAKNTGFILGTHYNAGEAVSLTEAQAKYLAPPYGSDVEVVPAAGPEPAAEPAPEAKPDKK